MKKELRDMEFKHQTSNMSVAAERDFVDKMKKMSEQIKERESKLEANDDVKNAVKDSRKARQDAKLTRLLPSRLANRLISRVTGVALHDYGCSLKAYRAEVLKDVRLYGEMHRFIPALAAWAGARVTEVEVTHHARRFGQSKYGLSRTLRVVLDLMTVRFLMKYSTRPLQLFGRWGLGLGSVGIILAVGALLARLGWSVPLGATPAFLLGALLVVGGIQLLFLGLGCELLARTYYEAQGKPIYFIRRVTRLAPEPSSSAPPSG
jgi:dolichol-phosphate mannosyltransferase